MDELKRAQLFGAGLIPVTSPELVARYNNALRELDLEPTRRKKFQIDGIGWSPEVAEELGDNLYLSHGLANPLAIILSPDQEGRPIYHPINSYVRRLLRDLFALRRGSIAEITSSTYLCLDIDNEVTFFRHPGDLLHVRHITVRATAGGLIRAARHQEALLQRFNSEPYGWFDETLRRELIASAEPYGDLRFRRVNVPEWRFEDFSSFYHNVFGGTFVIREKGAIIVVLCDPASAPDVKIHAEQFVVTDDALLDRLVELGLLIMQPESTAALTDLLMFLLVDPLTKADHEVNVAALTNPQLRKRIRECRTALPDAYFELEQLRVLLEESAPLNIEQLSREAQQLLLRPNPELPTPLRQVLWLLLTKRSPLNVLQLYEQDKNAFFELYNTWPPGKQAWAVQLISDRYTPIMLREEE